MKIIVCVKVVIDPEAPTSLFKVDSETNKITPPKGTPPVINPFDENALEAALQVNDKQPSNITILSMGINIPKPVIRKSLATGANNLVLLEDQLFDDLDTYSTANILASAIRKIKEYDLIICGREAADTDAGQVGLGIAEMLGIPSVSFAKKIVPGDKKIEVTKVLENGYEIIEVPLPALITVSSEVGSLRTANMQGIMAAQKKPMVSWNAENLGVIQKPSRRVSLLKLYQPSHITTCEIITGADPEESVANLVGKLKAIKVL